MASINSELTRFAFMEYLNSMSANELAYWLINSFSPVRYRNSQDVVEFACRILYQKSDKPELIQEFISRLWGMFGEEPDDMPFIKNAQVLLFRMDHAANNQSFNA